jgi:hypothetical protein
MTTPKGWTSYTGGIYSIELPARDSSKAHSDFRQTSLQEFLEMANLQRDGQEEHEHRDQKPKPSRELADH